MEDLRSWAQRENLSEEVVSVLEEQGFGSLQQIKADLEPEDIKEYFGGHLKVAQCMALKKAVKRLHDQAPGIQPTPPFQPPPAAPPGYPFPTAPNGMSPQGPFPGQQQPVYPNLEPLKYPPGPQMYPPPVAGCAGAVPAFSPSSGGFGEKFTFLLLGKTGSGKSTTGNTIFGEKLFNTASTFSSVTSECERRTSCRNGRKIEIIDSPGLYDTHKSHEEICVSIVQAVAGMHPGPHAVLYVVRLGRYTAEEFGAYTRLKALFDASITRYMVVLFTHGDMLEHERRSFEDLLQQDAPENLLQVLRDCKNRYVVFNNVAFNRQSQVERLLELTRGVLRENGGAPYSCPKYGQIGAGMEEEVARRLQEVERRDLQRQKYVQQLQAQTQAAEESAQRAQETFNRNEEERKRLAEQESERRRELEEKLQRQLEEQQESFKKHREELVRLQQEREEQERVMKEREKEMDEKERKRAEEEAERMRQQEEAMQARMKEQEERMARQREEDDARRAQMEKDRQEFLQQMEEQRQKEKEELERKETEKQRLLEEKMADERAEAKKKQELYEKEMEDLKQSYYQKQQFNDMLTKGLGFVMDAVKIGLDIYSLYKDGKVAEKDLGKATAAASTTTNTPAADKPT